MSSLLTPRQRWLTYRNDSGSGIGAYEVVIPTGIASVNGQYVLTVDQAPANPGFSHFFNDARPVADGELGLCTAHKPAWAAIDAATYAVGTRLNVKPGVSTLVKDELGPYVVIGDNPGTPNDSVVYVDLAIGTNDAFWAKITDRNGTAYSWVEVEPDGSACTFSTKAGGRSGTENAYEINCSQANFDVPQNLIVRMWQWDSTTYLFDRGLTNEDSNLRELLARGDTWDVNNQDPGKAGVKIDQILRKNSSDSKWDLLTVELDSHGQLTKVLDVNQLASSGPDCTDTPMNGSLDVVTDVQVQTVTGTVNPDCTISISITLQLTKQKLCFTDGIVHAAT